MLSTDDVYPRSAVTDLMRIAAWAVFRRRNPGWSQGCWGRSVLGADQVDQELHGPGVAGLGWAAARVGDVPVGESDRNRAADLYQVT